MKTFTLTGSVRTNVYRTRVVKTAEAPLGAKCHVAPDGARENLIRSRSINIPRLAALILPAVHCSLLTAHCPTAHRSLLTAEYTHAAT